MSTPQPTPPLSAWAQTLRAAWQQRPVRERRLLLAGGTLFLLLALWQWGIAPALSVWREAPARQARLETQTRQMLQLQAEAQRLQAPSRLGRTQALERLQASADRLLGSGAQLKPLGEQVHVTLQATPAPALAQWLAQAREQAQALPVQTQLKQAPRSSGESTEPLWQGSLVLRLP